MRIYLDGPLTVDLALCIVNKLKEAEAKNEESELYINTPGGVVVGCFAIIDQLRSMNTKVHGIVVGQASSAGCAIITCGIKKGYRAMTRNSELMAHMPRGVFEMDDGLEEAYADHGKNSQERLLEESTNLDLEQVKNVTALELYIDADEALELGFIDKII